VLRLHCSDVTLLTLKDLDGETHIPVGLPLFPLSKRKENLIYLDVCAKSAPSIACQYSLLEAYSSCREFVK